MLLSLLGICALVGPFQGPEWEPVRVLLTDQDRSCRHPQCCGNLLVSCLFGSPRKWTVASRRPDMHSRLAPAIHFSPRKFRELEAHIQQWAQKKRGRHQKQLWESWPLYLLPWPSPCREALSSAAPLCCGTPFPGTSTLPPDSVWESWPVSWVFSDDKIFKSLSPAAVEMYERMEHLLFEAQEELVSLEPVVNLRPDPPSVSLATALPPPQTLCICPQEFLLAPPSQPGAASSRERDRAAGKRRPTVGRDGGQRAQARGAVKQAKSSRQDAREAPAPGRQRLMGIRREDCADSRGLGGRSQTPGLPQKRVAAENRVATEELGDSSRRESGHEIPGAQEAGVQAPRGEDQEAVRGETDSETLTSGRAVLQDESGANGAAEAPVVQENRRATGGEIRGMAAQDQAGGEPRGGSRAQIPGDSGTETLAGEGRSQEQAGREKAWETRVSAGEGLGKMKQDDTETHGPAERAGQRPTSRAEVWEQLKSELQTWGVQRRRRLEGSRKTRLREVREEDWVVMQALWRADAMPVVSTTAGELGLAAGEHRSPTAVQHRAELQAAERRGQSTAEGAPAAGTEPGAPGSSRGSAGRTIWEQLDVEAPGETSPREAERANRGETQAPGDEEQAPTDSGRPGKTHWPEWETTQEWSREEGGTQAPRAGNGEESPDEAAEETHSSGAREAGGKSTELPAPENQVEDGEEDREEEGTPSPAGGESGTEAPEQRNESKAEGKGVVGETQSPKSGGPGPLGGDSAESHPPAGQDRERAGAGSEAEEQRSSQRAAGTEAAGVRERRAGLPTQLRSESAGETGWAEWPAAGEIGGDNDVGIEGERSPGGPSGDTETQTQAPGGDFGEESRSETGGERRVPGQGPQRRAEILAAGSQEVAGSREDKAQSEAVDAARSGPHLEPSAGEGAPTPAGSRGAAPGEEEAEASARCPASEPPPQPGELVARAEGAHSASRPMTPDGRHEETAAPLKARRRPRKNKAAGGGIAHPGPTSPMHPDPPALATHSGLPSRPWCRAPKASLVLDASTHPGTGWPKRLVLKSSQRLLLESVLRSKSTHLHWGLPQRILASHLLSASGPRPPPLAPTARPGFHGDCKQPGPRERPGEAQDSKKGREESGQQGASENHGKSRKQLVLGPSSQSPGLAQKRPPGPALRKAAAAKAAAATRAGADPPAGARRAPSAQAQALRGNRRRVWPECE
ncbi:collagen alpha-1(I) chain [Sorex araneus]|uniref:collagen alpha-1(I) chain n=1 Tax=Sorex araneus TaxID=42254 RepID=UPI0024333E5B|nr:collagen alpha-1(I) chain [Sorex araneus]